ncbi:MAG: TonB-dependent receptor [Candidatus Aminicenantes bacterium]|nr:TonB-dependent receptor [Candidatus Aminicenantes bacterium]
MIHSLSPFRSPIRTIAAVLGLAFVLAAGLPALAQQTEKAKEAEKPVRITEEIQVIGQMPRDQPVSTVTRIDFTKLEQNRPLDLAEAIRYAPGVYVTVGNKSEFTLKLRGMDSRRIVLLIDGVPSYEPYYGSFDLKTVAAAGIDTLQITKGPSSVLYGPNTLGGIVNVITRRPGSDPYLTLNAGFGADRTRSGGLDGGFRLGKFSLAGNLGYQGSHGYAYPDAATGEDVTYANTSYQRFNLNAKLFYAPSDTTELMINGNVYTSDYGMPAALGVQSARYWRFKNWDRYGLNAGGFTSLGGDSTLRFRAFAVNYQNTLDQYKDKAFSMRQFESTFDNSVYGAFALADFGLTAKNRLKASLNFQKDIARTQDDINLPFVEYNQGTFSAALEDELRLTGQWRLVGGVSLDVIDKFVGDATSRLNPMLGLKFSPNEALDLHVSASMKSRMPNMRALYSASSGNPDLLGETGTNAELGAVWTKGVFISASLFTYRFKNMIDTYTLPDGTRRYMNVGKAHITGAEIQLQKSIGPLDATLNYTNLDHRNDVDDRPLDALSPHSLNFDLTVRPLVGFRLSVYGMFGSQSSWWDSKAAKVLDIPSYFNLDAVLAYDWKMIQLFVKATNLLNDYFYVEPIFPWRGRFIEFGVKMRAF